MGCTVNAAWPYFLLPGAERAVTLSASLIDCLPLCVWFTGKHSFVLLMGGWNHKEAYSKDKHMACTTSWLSLNYLCNIWKICIHDFCGIFTLLFYYLFIYLLNWFIQGNKKKKGDSDFNDMNESQTIGTKIWKNIFCGMQNTNPQNCFHFTNAANAAQLAFNSQRIICIKALSKLLHSRHFCFFSFFLF